MFRKIELFFTAIVVLFGVSQIESCPPYPVGWNFLDPQQTTPDPKFSGSIGCNGEATSADGYTVKVMFGSQTLASVGGTSSCGSWSNTVVEPQNGWNGNGNYIDAELELWNSGTMKHRINIQVK